LKAAALSVPGTVEVIERARPIAVDELVVVKILVAPMCTENKARRAGEITDSLGHEAAGVVVDSGMSKRVKSGDRVVVMPGFACGTCRYCLAGEHIYCPFPRDILAETGQSYGTATYAEYILKPDWLLLPVPDTMSLNDAAAACCLFGPTFNANQRMALSGADTLLVTGCGPVGLGAIVQGIHRGARVLALETHPYRLTLAHQLGAEVLNPLVGNVEQDILDRTDGWGVTAAIETSGVPSNASLIARVSARRGRVGFVAWGSDLSLPPLPPLGLDIFGCWHWNHQVMGPQMIETIARCTAPLRQAVTHRFLLDDVSAAMDLQDSGNCGKVQLFPHGMDAEGIAAS